MLVHCGLFLLFLNCVRTTAYVYPNGLIKDRVVEGNKRFSWWPSVHNAASLVKMKREVDQLAQEVAAGKHEGDQPPLTTPASQSSVGDIKSVSDEVKQTAISNTTVSGNITVTTLAPVAPVVNTTDSKTNNTTEKVKQLDLNNPGVIKRGFIVFGGFALLAIAYFIFYRRKGKNNDTSNTHNSNDANQFRYGVLQSDDRRDNLELSRVPLTMESDDDEDEDLEIFDLEQKKKSLSYVNLQTNDEDVVFSNKEYSENDRENLLLDIEDGTSHALINWSSNGSKSIL